MPRNCAAVDRGTVVVCGRSSSSGQRDPCPFHATNTDPDRPSQGRSPGGQCGPCRQHIQREGVPATPPWTGSGGDREQGLEGEATPLTYHSGTEGHLVNRVGQHSSSLQSSAETALDAIGGVYPVYYAMGAPGPANTIGTVFGTRISEHP